VTRAGELLDADGTLTVGDAHAGTGILSRKSELRELRAEAERLATTIARLEGELAAARDAADALDGPIRSLEQSIDEMSERASALHDRISERRGRRGDLHERVTLSRSEIAVLEANIARLEKDWSAARERVAAAELSATELQRVIDEAAAETQACEQEQSRARQELTAVQIALEKVKERLAGYEARFSQADADLALRRREAAQVAEQERAALARLESSRLAILTATAALAEHYLDKERAESLTAEFAVLRESRRAERRELTERLDTIRGASAQQRSEAHSLDLSISTLEANRKSIADRLREDYQFECGSGEEQTPASAPLDPTAVNEEITRLNKQVRSLGNVNLEALAELAEVEARAKEMQEQIDDLTGAQASLQEIIDRINADSRRLFGETFATVRSHFQELFRKLFAGGMADVILEDESDVLESGIEINARPPGKELRSISLMSGGEKTMTAVALLLAIFRSKPSPFCLLDEVDAALDEGNTARLASVLREFLDRSQFIIITHKKRTMAAADVLYGVTMQESGVSKQVSVKFEDWPDEVPGAAAA
jgi:chromosome segregation protein